MIMNNLFDIAGRTVVVTGGTGILGSTICRYLAKQGAQVAILDRNAESGAKLESEIQAAGGEAFSILSMFWIRNL